MVIDGKGGPRTRRNTVLKTSSGISDEDTCFFPSTVPWGGLWRGALRGGPDYLLPQLRHSRLPSHGRPDHEASGPELFLVTHISQNCHTITRFFWWILISLTQSCLTLSSVIQVKNNSVKLKVVQDLWERKLLLTKQVLEAQYDD